MGYLRQTGKDELIITDENGKDRLRIREKAEGRDMVFVLSGELKNEYSFEFEDELNAVLSVQPRIRIDMSSLSYIASDGLKAILDAQKTLRKEAGGNLILSGLSGQVLESFESSGFMPLFIISEKGEIIKEK